MKKTDGFTLIEAMLAMGIVVFVVVAILAGFTQQMASNHTTNLKNSAISLAENKMEEYMKFPAAQMPASSVDYVFESNHRFVTQTAPPDDSVKIQFRRTTTVVIDGTMRTVRVLVEYGMSGSNYPFSVVLTSRRGE